MRKSLFILALLLIPTALIVTLYSTLPFLINQYSPHILTRYDLENTAIRVDRLTAKTLTGGLSLGNQKDRIIELPLIEAGFSLKSLRKKKVEKVVVKGGVIHLEIIDGSLQLPGVKRINNTKAPTRPLLPFILPFLAEEVAFSNSLIIIHQGEEDDIELIVDGTVTIDSHFLNDTGYQVDKIEGSLFTRGDIRTAFNFTMNGTDDRVVFHGNLTTPDVSSVSSLVLPPSMLLYGAATLKTDITLSKRLDILESKTELQLKNLSFTGLPLTVRSPEQESVILTFLGNSDQLRYSISTIQLNHKDSGQSLFISSAGTINPARRKFTGSTTLTSPLLSHPLSVDLSGNNSTDGFQLTASLSGEQQNISQNGITVEIGPYNIDTNLIKKKDTGISIATDMHIGSLKSGEKNVSVKNITSRFSGSIEAALFSDGEGNLKIEDIAYNSRQFGGAALTFSTTASSAGVQFVGSIMSELADDLKLDLEGSLDSELQLHAVYQTPPISLDESTISSLIPIDNDLLFGGILRAGGEIYYPPANGRNTLNLQLADGYISQKESKLDISGITGEITFPDLPSLHSVPSQLFTIDSLQLNSLEASDGSFYFRVEDDHSLFLEKSRLSWCGGKVEVAATRITPELREFSTTMYCDRLQFSDLLNQFGISDTEGDGSLNGRLPVQFSKEGLFFDDGFLFSTPGNSGIVRFNSTEILKQGLPDMNQAAYLDYSLMALENFSYNWTKLTFNSSGDDLQISMQIDGKPAEPLPFGYKKGHIAVDPNGTGIQHPLQLTVNFNLPIREMFRYGQNFQKIMEKM